MRYLLAIYGDEEAWQSAPAADREAAYAEYAALAEELGRRGMMVDGAELEPTAAATTVRVRDGRTLVADGPFAETKEQLGGYFLVQCDTLDEAIEAAAGIPAARTGTIEVRPLRER
ncbi:MAG TPA: YciI family protein [Gaiellales bacterium]|nr:YciI family protein [Gaiellales bacterium]